MEPRDTGRMDGDFSFHAWLGGGAYFMDENHEIKWLPDKAMIVHADGKTWNRIGWRTFQRYASIELKEAFYNFKRGRGGI